MALGMDRFQKKRERLASEKEVILSPSLLASGKNERQ